MNGINIVRKMVQSIHGILAKIGLIVETKDEEKKHKTKEALKRKNVYNPVVLYIEYLFEFKFCKLQFAHFILFSLIQILVCI